MRHPRRRRSRCSNGSGAGCRGTGPWPPTAAADDASDGHSRAIAAMEYRNLAEASPPRAFTSACKVERSLAGSDGKRVDEDVDVGGRHARGGIAKTFAH